MWPQPSTVSSAERGSRFAHRHRALVARGRVEAVADDQHRVRGDAVPRPEVAVLVVARPLGADARRPGPDAAEVAELGVGERAVDRPGGVGARVDAVRAGHAREALEEVQVLLLDAAVRAAIGARGRGMRAGDPRRRAPARLDEAPGTRAKSGQAASRTSTPSVMRDQDRVVDRLGRAVVVGDLDRLAAQPCARARRSAPRRRPRTRSAGRRRRTGGRTPAASPARRRRCAGGSRTGRASPRRRCARSTRRSGRARRRPRARARGRGNRFAYVTPR